MSLWEKRSAKWHKYKRHKEKSFRLSCVFVLWIIKCHFGHKDSFLFAPFIAAVQKYSVHLTVESAMFMHLPNTEVRILHSSLSCDNYLIYRQQWRFDIFFPPSSPPHSFPCAFSTLQLFSPKVNNKGADEIFSKTHGLIFFPFQICSEGRVAVWEEWNVFVFKSASQEYCRHCLSRFALSSWHQQTKALFTQTMQHAGVRHCSPWHTQLEFYGDATQNWVLSLHRVPVSHWWDVNRLALLFDESS